MADIRLERKLRYDNADLKVKGRLRGTFCTQYALAAPVATILWWTGDCSFYETIKTLYWRPDNRLTEGVLRFRVYCFPHYVYPSVGRVALFSVDSCRCLA